MIGDVVLPDTRPEEWPRIREFLKNRIQRTFGMPSSAFPAGKAQVKDIEPYEKYGLAHLKLKYHVIDDEWNEAVIILPKSGNMALPAPAVLAVHGSNGALGKNGCVEPATGIADPYAIELAMRGYVAMAVDQLGFGATIDKIPQKDLYAKFYERHPGWTLDGRRLHEQKRALDVLEQMKEVKPGAFCIIGNSLGGRAVMHLAAMDERVKAAVVSAGISPNCTNVYRRITWSEPQNPMLSREIQKAFGQVPWDYHEMIALCAPRGVLSIEPYNDDYNPDVNVTIACLSSASKVYKLCKASEKLSFLIHGEGHGTGDALREYAYSWFDRQVQS